MAITFETCKPGDTLPGIKILSKRTKTVLAVYTCCGKTIEVKKRTLERRIESGSDKCSECSKYEKYHAAGYALLDEDDAPLTPAPARFSGVYFGPGEHGIHWWVSLSDPAKRDSYGPRGVAR